MSNESCTTPTLPPLGRQYKIHSVARSDLIVDLSGGTTEGDDGLIGWVDIEGQNQKWVIDRLSNWLEFGPQVVRISTGAKEGSSVSAFFSGTPDKGRKIKCTPSFQTEATPWLLFHVADNRYQIGFFDSTGRVYLWTLGNADRAPSITLQLAGTNDDRQLWSIDSV